MAKYKVSYRHLCCVIIDTCVMWPWYMRCVAMSSWHSFKKRVAKYTVYCWHMRYVAVSSWRLWGIIFLWWLLYIGYRGGTLDTLSLTIFIVTIYYVWDIGVGNAHAHTQHTHTHTHAQHRVKSAVPADIGWLPGVQVTSICIYPSVNYYYI